MFRTVTQVLAAAQYRQKLKYYLPNTVKHEKTCSYCQKPECLHVVNKSAIAQLPGIKLIQ